MKSKSIKKIQVLENLFLEHKKMDMKQIMKALNISCEQSMNLVSSLRKGTKVLKSGTQKRPAYNIQSVSKDGNQHYRHYVLIDKDTKPESIKEVLIRVQKEVSTKGKYTFIPTSKSFIKAVPLIQAKKFLLASQEVIIDSYLLENEGGQTKKINIVSKKHQG